VGCLQGAQNICNQAIIPGQFFTAQHQLSPIISLKADHPQTTLFVIPAKAGISFLSRGK
jgi:hypothetical protein